MSEIWYWISLPYATFAIISDNGIVVDTAPIAKWARKLKIDYVLSYYNRRGAKIVKL